MIRSLSIPKVWTTLQIKKILKMKKRKKSNQGTCGFETRFSRPRMVIMESIIHPGIDVMSHRVRQEKGAAALRVPP